METKTTYRTAVSVNRGAKEYAEERVETLSGEDCDEILEKARAREKQICVKHVLANSGNVSVTVWTRFETPEIGDIGFHAAKFRAAWPAPQTVTKYGTFAGDYPRKQYLRITSNSNK